MKYDYEYKIHLRLNENNDTACKSTPSFTPKLVTAVYEKVTCAHCKRIVSALKNPKTKTGLHKSP
jgi:hypothetical protein